MQLPSTRGDLNCDSNPINARDLPLRKVPLWNAEINDEIEIW
jgi:hypothetical protein